jgi:hypothetical protein
MINLWFPVWRGIPSEKARKYRDFEVKQGERQEKSQNRFLNPADEAVESANRK